MDAIQDFKQDLFTPGLIPAASKAKPNTETGRRRTNFDGQRTIPLMVRHGSNPFEYDAQGASPCHWLAGAGNLQGVEALLEVVSLEAEAMATTREPK
jgi:hypothetical protein